METIATACFKTTIRIRHRFSVSAMAVRAGDREARPRRRIRLSRHFRLFAGLAALSVFAFPLVQASAQQQVPPAPAEPQAAPAQEPSAPAPAAPPTFPKPDPSNFTATSPTKEAVDAFLRQNWGFDENRVWEIEAILKTPVEGMSKVVIYMGDKTGKQKMQGLSFFVVPDGKHIIAGDQIMPFGEHPFAD